MKERLDPLVTFKIKLGSMDGFIETSRTGLSKWGVWESFGTRVGGLKESFGFVVIVIYGILVEPFFIAHIANNILTIKKKPSKKEAQNA